jgi:hypothetical protein
MGDPASMALMAAAAPEMMGAGAAAGATGAGLLAPEITGAMLGGMDVASGAAGMSGMAGMGAAAAPADLGSIGMGNFMSLYGKPAIKGISKMGPMLAMMQQQQNHSAPNAVPMQMPQMGGSPTQTALPQRPSIGSMGLGGSQAMSARLKGMDPIEMLLQQLRGR